MLESICLDTNGRKFKFACFVTAPHAKIFIHNPPDQKYMDLKETNASN